MVRFTSVLCRVPVIKFRKGGLGAGSAPAASAGAPKKLGGCPIGRAPPAAAMSTLPDVDLPARYKRRPLSQEEIDHINGGGVV